jgi:hypothetical protein
LGRAALKGKIGFEGREEAGLAGRVKVGRTLPEREAAEGPGSGLKPSEEGVGGSNIDLTDVPRAPRSSSLLDDVEVAVSTAVAELEGPNHGSIRCDKTFYYIAGTVRVDPSRTH